jgi:hypothetical protein
MFRCYFNRPHQESVALDLDVLTIDAAIVAASRILADHLDPRDFSGIEVWRDQTLLCKSAV